MPVLDQVQYDGSGIQNVLELLDSAKASLRVRISSRHWAIFVRNDGHCLVAGRPVISVSPVMLRSIVFDVFLYQKCPNQGIGSVSSREVLTFPLARSPAATGAAGVTAAGLATGAGSATRAVATGATLGWLAWLSQKSRK